MSSICSILKANFDGESIFAVKFSNKNFDSFESRNKAEIF